MSQPTAQSLLNVLTKPHLIALGRDVDVTVPPTATKDAQIAALVGSGKFHFRELLRRLGRDDLKAACRAHEIDDSGRAREQLSVRLLAARGVAETVAPTPLFLGG
jgi:type I restriction enzyme M protein